MKKIFWFSIISGATLVVLIIVFVIGFALILSARVENTAPDISSATASTAQPAPKDISREILLIFDGDDCFMSQLNVTNDGELQFSTLFPNGRIGDLSLKEYIDKNTPDEAVASICGRSAHFIKISPKNFTEITDRYGGLVYNEGNGREVMLTGAQGLTALNGTTFTDFVVQIVSKAQSRDLYDLFLYVSNNTQNNLSYIAFHDIFKKENTR